MSQTVKRLPTVPKTRFQSLGWENPLEKEVATHCSTLTGKSHGWRSLVGYSPQGCKELYSTERLYFTLIIIDSGRGVNIKWTSFYQDGRNSINIT